MLICPLWRLHPHPGEEGSVLTVAGRRAALSCPVCGPPWHPTGIWDVFINSPRPVRCYVLQRFFFFFHKWHRPLLMSIIKFWTKCCPRYNCLLWRSSETILLEFISFWHFRNVFLDWSLTRSKTCCHFKLITLIPKRGRWEHLSFWNLASISLPVWDSGWGCFSSSASAYLSVFCCLVFPFYVKKSLSVG